MSLSAMVEWVQRVLNIEVSGGRPPNPVAEQAQAANAALLKRLPTLIKTAVYARSQPPDIAIRILQSLSGELEAAHEAVKQADGVGLTGNALTLRNQVAIDLAAAPTKALELAKANAKTWLGDIAKIPAARAPVDAKARAKLLLPLINTVGTGMDEDQAMLARVNADGSTVFAPVKVALGKLRTEYESLRPKRTPGKEPTRAEAISRPLLGGAEEPKKLKDNLALIETEMANGRAPDPALVAEAVDLIKSKINVLDAETEMKARKNWDAVKAEYKRLTTAVSPDAGKAYMSKMWWFRRQAVDGQMLALQKEYGFAWGSVGSANPESDYDVTVRAHGTTKTGEVYYDYKIVADFNKAVSAPFGGTPPGILFDTNLYAEAAVTPPTGAETPTGKAMGAMTEQGQDVGALMKLRRYMDWDDYEDYKQKTLAALPKEQRALTQRQFEEADSLYFIARSEQLAKAGVKVDDLDNSPQGQQTLEERAQHLEHDNPEKTMETNNALYLQKMEEVRKLEKTLLAERDGDKKAALLAKLRSLQADATFFAAEAYHSEGPLKHVVQAGQSSKVEVNNDPAFAEATAEAKKIEIDRRKAAKLASYSATQMLQSFNENLGDMLKDLRHYESEPFPGLGFYRSSKYLERVCDAAILTGSKLPDPAKLEFAKLKLGGKAPGVVQTALGGLVDIRGEAKMFVGVDDPEEEKQAYAIAEMAKIFAGVTTLRDLGKLVSTFGQQVNALVRATVTEQMATANEAPYFQAAAR
jgi:hypothetical protein